MRKSYICALLATALLLGSLSGCKAPVDPTEPTNPTNPTNPTEPTEPEVELTPAERLNYMPRAFTLNIYDPETNTYSFVWNTDSVAMAPVVQICEGEEFDAANAVSYPAQQESIEYVEARDDGDIVRVTHVCKARISLEPGKTYSYRCYDTKTKVGGATYKFTPKDTTAHSFTFAHISDSQSTLGDYNSGMPLWMVLNQLAKGETTPDFLLHTGDFVHYGISEPYWRNMLELSANFLGGMPFATIGGNHEMVGYGGSQYDILRHFDAKMPQQDCTKGYYYSFDYGDVRFIQLNTNDAFGSSKKLSDEQYNWLVEQLETNDKKWLIVGMHHGMYSVGSWGNDSRIVHITKGLRNQLSDLFAQYGVDLVLQGHDHTYSYTYPIAEGHTALQDAPTEGDYFVNPQGVVYGMHGPAGDQPSDPWETYEEEYYKFAGRGEESSWAEVTVEEDRLTVTVKRYVAGAAEIVTTYGIIKN